MVTRRDFLAGTAAVVAGAAGLDRALYAAGLPLGLPLGLQLYSVRKQLADDYQGTLGQIASLGYREVEAAGFGKMSAAEVKQAMQKANLRCVSSHVPFNGLQPHLDEVLAFSKELGVEYLICSSPGLRPTSTEAGAGRRRTATLDDWKYNADQFNQMGEKAAASGLRFGYHNHVAEFAPTDGAVPFLELLKATDPAKVTFELDCGWAIVGGANPVDLMREHPGRFSMLHVKDFKSGSEAGSNPHEPTVTELGMGSIDYRPIFAQAAKTQKIKHMFVEQEAYDMPWVESLKVDAEYIRKLG